MRVTWNGLFDGLCTGLCLSGDCSLHLYATAAAHVPLSCLYRTGDISMVEPKPEMVMSDKVDIEGDTDRCTDS